MNFFAPRDGRDRQERSSYNRGSRDSYDDNRSRSRGRSRDGRRDNDGYNFREASAKLLPPIDSILYQAADSIDPAKIDYSFYDMPVKVKHSDDQPDVKPYIEFSSFL